ncbi:MAG: hypothetical protein AAFQ82_01935, partial [Myxococcota bacterium]
IYAALDARSCSYEALAASDADIVLADIGLLSASVAQSFLTRVPTTVLIALRSSAQLGTEYATAMNGVNALIGRGAPARPIGCFVTRHNPVDLDAARALNWCTDTVDFVCPPMPEAVGMKGPALVGTGMGEVYRAVAEAARTLVAGDDLGAAREHLAGERQNATPVQVGLSDLATAFRQSGKRVESQTGSDGFPVESGAAASQYTYVLDSQALADVVGAGASPLVQPAAQQPVVEYGNPVEAPRLGEMELFREQNPTREPPAEEYPDLDLSFQSGTRSRLMMVGAVAAAVVVGGVVLAFLGGAEPAVSAEAPPSVVSESTVSAPTEPGAVAPSAVADTRPEERGPPGEAPGFSPSADDEAKVTDKRSSKRTRKKRRARRTASK